ncbi:MAG: GHMP kinase [Acidobacteriota bacterium]|nr:GHMP kinase [Acidobacteriota bacterium]
MLIVRTPVRISFAGGGTDFPSYYEKYGGLVLSTSIDKYVYTVLTERDDQKAQIISSDLKTLESYEQIEKMKLQGIDLEIPFAVLKHLRCNAGVNLFMASEVPPGTGLGSSAAVCVNLLKTLRVYLGLDDQNLQLAEEAFHIARDVLHWPVGKQDEYGVAVGGMKTVKFEAGGVRVEPLRLSPDMLMDLEQNLLLFFTGSARESSAILSGQDRSVQQREEAVLDALAELKGLVPRMRQKLVDGNFAGFGDLLDEGWVIKKRISNKISNPRIDSIYEAAKRCGATGGKITGAGGGGFLLLYCERDRQAAVRAGLSEFGLKELRFHFDMGGSRVVYNDPFFDSSGRGGMRWAFSPSFDQLRRATGSA